MYDNLFTLRNGKVGSAVRHVPTSRSGKLAADVGTGEDKEVISVDFGGEVETVAIADLRIDLTGTTWRIS